MKATFLTALLFSTQLVQAQEDKIYAKCVMTEKDLDDETMGIQGTLILRSEVGRDMRV